MKEWLKAFETLGWAILTVLLFVAWMLSIDSMNPCSQFYDGYQTCSSDMHKGLLDD